MPNKINLFSTGHVALCSLWFPAKDLL